MNTNNGVKWRRFIVPKKVEKVNEKHAKTLNPSHRLLVPE